MFSCCLLSMVLVCPKPGLPTWYSFNQQFIYCRAWCWSLCAKKGREEEEGWKARKEQTREPKESCKDRRFAKFDEKLPGEKPPKHPGKHRKFFLYIWMARNSLLARNSDETLDVGKASSRIQPLTWSFLFAMPTIIGTAPCFVRGVS